MLNPLNYLYPPKEQKKEDPVRMKELIITATILGLYLYFGTAFICHIMGSLVPAYNSIKSLKLRKKINQYWLTYWAIYSILSFPDYFFTCVPFYYYGKLVLIIWLQKGGATYLYDYYIQKNFPKLEKEVDEYTGKVKDGFNEMMVLIFRRKQKN